MKGLRTLTDFDKLKAKDAAEEYKEIKKRKNKKVSSAILGFIVKNGIYGKTEGEIDTLIGSAEKLHDGTILGEGDKFKIWCKKHGRIIPSNALVTFMNADPYDAVKEVKKTIPIDTRLWRAWCTYRAGRGRFNV